MTKIENSKTRFTATVKYYDAYRPIYPDVLYSWVIAKAGINPPDVVVDLGCGTGIATRVFAERGFKCFGIEPNEDMLVDAKSKSDDITFQKGDAEKTGLSDNFTNLVVSAQAFHWFDIPKTMTELKRILKPDGSVCAFWNVRVKTPFALDFEVFSREYSNDYKKTPKAPETIGAIKASSEVTTFEEAAFPNLQEMNLEALIGQAYSKAYIAHGVKDHEGYKKELEKLFDLYQVKGKVVFEYETKAIWWKL